MDLHRVGADHRPRSPTRSTPRTRGASSTATSSRRTSWSAATATRARLPRRLRAHEARRLGRRPDPRRRLGRHARLRGPGADPGPQGRPPRGHLLARLRAVRDADRRRRVPQGQRHGEAVGARHRPAADAAAPTGRTRRGLRRRRRPRHGEGPRRALRDRGRARRGPSGGRPRGVRAPGARGRQPARERSRPLRHTRRFDRGRARTGRRSRGRGRRRCRGLARHLGRHAVSAADAGPAATTRPPHRSRCRSPPRPAVAPVARRPPRCRPSRADAHSACGSR